MIIYPAIDCREGHCVRLYQGDYQQEIIYGNSPVEIANAFAAEGATWLHLVDLDSAKNLSNSQTTLIKRLIKEVPLSVQVGGGIRTIDQIEAYFESGAARVVIGSLAVTSPAIVQTWLQRFDAEQLVLAFDVTFDLNNQPRVMTHAWQQTSQYFLFELISTYVTQGLKHVLCTDISRDGTLTGPNIRLYQALAKQFPALNIQASGGIRALKDFTNLKQMGVAGAITGRALYEKKFSLTEALSC
jgi:phosphoribosylformimino-5-aminoimidazole carboxamide ribotide isomerase